MALSPLLQIHRIALEKMGACISKMGEQKNLAVRTKRT